MTVVVREASTRARDGRVRMAGPWPARGRPASDPDQLARDPAGESRRPSPHVDEPGIAGRGAADSRRGHGTASPIRPPPAPDRWPAPGLGRPSVTRHLPIVV